MQNDALVQAIEERIRSLQEFKRLVISSPDMVPLLKQFFSINGTSAAPEAMHKIKGESLPKKKGKFIQKVEETCRALGTGHFTVNDAVKAFEERGNAFNAENKSIAMYSALKRLVKRKVVEITAQGEGSRPSYYRVVQ